MKNIFPTLFAWCMLGAAPAALAQQASAPPCVSACAGVLGENIYPNGDFGAGTPNVITTNPNLAPGYQYQPSPPPNDGYYTIANSTINWGWFAGNYWIDIEDNGPEPNGYFMVVNASYPPGLFFQNSVAVCENTMYEFSIDVINLFFSQYPTAIKPNLSFLIDDVVYCTTGDIPSDQAWHTMRFSFTTAPGQTSVKLAMQNNAPGGYGNDLALDNISFRACGPELATSDTVGFCTGHPALLEAQLLSNVFASPKYQWQIFSNGAWENIPGADTTVLLVNNPQDGALYRLLTASALANLQELHCRAVSGDIRLKELPPVQLQTSAVDVACFGQQNGSAQALPLNGTAPFAYLWNDGSTDTLLSNLAPGTYSLLVTDAKGCRGSTSISISEPASLVSMLSAQPVDCFGETSGEVFATVSGGTTPYSFSWNAGSNNDTLTSVAAGEYRLTLTDAHGCSATASATVDSPSALSALSGAMAVSCYGGQDGLASVSLSGGTPPYVYAWNIGETELMVTNLLAGTYTVTATDANGCTLSTSVDITEPPLLTLTTSSADVPCFGGFDGSALATGAGGTAPYSFLWNNGQETATISGLSAATYSVTMTDVNGCSQTATVAIQQAAALVTAVDGTDVACYGGADGLVTATASGGASPYQFVWSTGQNAPQLTGLPASSYGVTITDANGCTGAAEFMIESPPPLQIQVVAEQVSCFGLANGQLNAMISGGATPYQFLWNTGQSTAMIDGIPAGIYSLTLTDAHGCSSTVSTEIQQPALLTLSASASEVQCFGGSNAEANAAAAGGTAPYFYQWSQAGTGQQISGLTAGVYTVTVADTQGCTAIQSVLVTEPPALNATGGVLAASCFGASNGLAWVDVSGGQAPYQYQWSHGATTMQATNLQAGAYTVTVTDARACTHSASWLVEQPAALEAQVTTVPVACAGQANGSASVMLSGGTTPYVVQWSNQQTTQQISNLLAGTYSLTVIDAHGCTQSVSATVTEPAPLEAESRLEHVACFGDASGSASITLHGGTTPYSYLWQNGQSSHTLSQVPAGVYSVTAVDAHGCALSASMTVQQPTALSSQVQSLDARCFGSSDGSASALASGGVAPYTFLWLTGETTAQINHLPSGWYDVEITDAHQCRTSNQIWIDQPTPLDLATHGKPVSCSEVTDGMVSANAAGGVGPYTFLWNTGQTGEAIQHLASGAYTVTATDGHGCTVTASQAVGELPGPSVSLGLDQTIELGEAMLLSAQTNLPGYAIAEYIWTGDAGEQRCDDCSELQFVPIAGGCERVRVRDIHGCEAEDVVCYQVRRERHIYVPNVFSPDGNGENDFFTIYSDASVKEIKYLSVYDRWGEHLFKATGIPTNHDPSGWNGLYRDTPMNPGVYVWVAEVEFIDGEVILLKGDVTLVR